MPSEMVSQEFVDGYIDGRDPTTPEPSSNRSHRYRHSFAVGRTEITEPFRPIGSYEAVLKAADEAEAKDLAALSDHKDTSD